MSKKQVLSKEEIAAVHGALGEIAPYYLALRGENTKTGESEIGASYLAVKGSGTKGTN
ncbi:MAG TPA: hypothetical protein VN089_03755 [Duganella sp.]|nr:hypothetical protein [Duganella sp.]